MKPIWYTRTFLESDRISRMGMERYIGILLNRGWQPVVDYDTPFGTAEFLKLDSEVRGLETGSLDQAIEASVQQQEAYIGFGRSFPFERDGQQNVYRVLLDLFVKHFDAPKGLDNEEDCETAKPFLEVGFDVDLIQWQGIPGAYKEIYELSCTMFESLNPLYGFGDGSDLEYMGLGMCDGPSYPEILGDTRPPIFWLNYFTKKHLEIIGENRVLECAEVEVREYETGGTSLFLGYPLSFYPISGWTPSKGEWVGEEDYEIRIIESLNLRSWWVPDKHPLLMKHPYL